MFILLHIDHEEVYCVSLVERLAGGLIVSCQAPDGDPLDGPDMMARMAKAAELGGAVGIRADGPGDIAAIRAGVALPIIGIYKIKDENTPVYITPTFASAQAVAKAGADIIAIDGTQRPRAGATSLQGLIEQIHAELHLPVMADVSTLDEGIQAARAGADIVATTLSGYTPYSRPPQHYEPDFELIRELAGSVSVPVIAEGRFTRPEHVEMAFDAGAYAVVVGTAITRPQWIVEQFAKKAQRHGIKPLAG